MTKSSSTSRSLFILLLTAAALAPTSAFASVHIVDIMYDPPGADQGREWIKITNTGDAPVDIAKYRLYEGGTNHKLTVAAGTSTLPAGAVAIIATDPAQYAADNPAFAGAIFRSSFSLSNVGETIELKDPLLAVVDTYSYTAPPVVKEPLPPKVTKPPKSIPIATKTKTSTGNASSYTAGANQAASVALVLPALGALPSVWYYGMGLAALLVLGAGAALYARPSTFGVPATSSPREEFELE